MRGEYLYFASVSLSGINVFGTAGKWYVTNGRKCPSVNILPQFNGTNDHLIFKVKPGTKFVPYDCKHYNIQASADYTYIERLVGEPRALPYGFMWWHLNAMRANIYHKQLDNFASTPDGFSEISDLLNLSAPEIYGVLNSDFVSDSSKVLFTFYYAHCRAEIPLKSLSQINLPYSEKPKE